MLIRRKAAALAGIGAVALSLSLAACSSNDDPAGGSSSASGASADAAGGASGEASAAGGGETVTLTFMWWGSDARAQKTQGVIDAFEAANPDIKIEPMPTDWTGYWDKLATQVAAGDAPDIIQMDEKYLREYSDRGALYDLSTMSNIETADLIDSATTTGVTDSGLTGIVSAINAPDINVNPALFQAAGVDVPDDKTWTWDDFVNTAAAITAASSADGVYGLQSFGLNDVDVRTWTRSNCGVDLFTKEGGLGVTEDCMTQFFDFVNKVRDAKATPEPSVENDWATGAQDQGGLATGKAAMANYWSNQIVALSSTLGSDLNTLLVPGITGAKISPMWYKPSMFWSASSQTKYPEQVGRFLNFIINSPEAGAILLTERGVPVNNKVLEAITPNLSEGDAKVAKYVSDAADYVGATPPLTPPGGGSAEDTLRTYTSQVLFGSMSPADAAKAYVSDVQSALDQAKSSS